MAGHIKLDRKILDWEWYSDANTCRLFIHLLLIANYKDSKWRGQLIQRGQVITGLLKLNEDTGLSVSQLRTSFDKLKMTGEITIKVTNKFRIVTICKYDSYQSFKDENDKQNSNLNNNQVASQSQANDKQIATSNKNKEVNKERKEENTSSPVGGAFWGLYEKMIGIYIKIFEGYFRDDKKDYPACNIIARKIEERKGWEMGSCMNGKIDEFLSEWEKMNLRAKENAWLSKMTLTELCDREWQKWCKSMANMEKGTNSKEERKAKQEKKEPQSVSARLIAQQYD